MALSFRWGYDLAIFGGNIINKLVLEGGVDFNNLMGLVNGLQL